MKYLFALAVVALVVVFVFLFPPMAGAQGVVVSPTVGCTMLANQREVTLYDETTNQTITVNGGSWTVESCPPQTTHTHG